MILKTFPALSHTTWSKAVRHLSVLRFTSPNIPTVRKTTYLRCATTEKVSLQFQATSFQFSRLLSTQKELTEMEYEVIADETLDSLAEMFEDLAERIDCDSDYDVLLGSGVLTVHISKEWGTIVINKQVPNKQIWFSSPISGPKRFDLVKEAWIYKHDGSVLHDVLTEEISDALKEPVDFSICSYGRPS